MKHSISKRIFFITLTLILLLVSFTMIFQMAFFQKFYLDRKNENLQSAVKKFRTFYSFDVENADKLYKALGIFEMENNAKIAIYSTNGTIKYISDKDGANSEEMKTLNELFKELNSDPNLTQKFLESNDVVTTLFSSKYYSTKQLVCMSPFSVETKNDSILIALSSFKPIEESTAVIQEFYKYILIAVLFIGLFLSYLYSNLISKPLVKINKTAKKMSAMDFSEHCTVDRDDEIGSLAKTLNFLSQNLSSALKDLKIKNKKLEDDIEKERQLEKLRKDFIAGVSHELKTPIGIISGYAEGLKDNIVEEDSRDMYLDIILDEADKMNTLVMNMLELSRLESGKTELNTEKFDIVSVTNNIILKNGVDIKNKNLNLKTNYFKEDIIALGDTFKIDQVITNFLTNAIKYSPENNDIIISIGDLEESILFSIENTGVHINEEELPKIWHQFYRVDSSRNRAGRSTGLGLPIVKNILNLHKSDFGVVNTENGVKFYFTLLK